MNLQTAQQIIAINQRSYQNMAEDFSDSRSFSWQEVKQTLKKYIKDGDKILDLGCGNGRLLKSLDGFSDLDYIGLDNCSKFISNNQKMISKKQSKLRIKFINDDILNLAQFKENEFNAIFMIASFHHIPSNKLRERVMADLSRILKPGGFLIMVNWNLWQIGAKKSFWRYNWKNKSKGIKKISSKDLGLRDIITFWQNKYPLYYYAFTKKDLKKIFKKFNFKVLENKYVKKGKKASWWNGWNILTVGEKL